MMSSLEPVQGDYVVIDMRPQSAADADADAAAFAVSQWPNARAPITESHSLTKQQAIEYACAEGIRYGRRAWDGTVDPMNPDLIDCPPNPAAEVLRQFDPPSSGTEDPSS